MKDLRLAWIGSPVGFEPLLERGEGTFWNDADALPAQWVRAASPAEAAVRADFVFVRASRERNWMSLLRRGIVRNGSPGACIVLVGDSDESLPELAAFLDTEGFDTLDLVLLPDPPRVVVGGDRDTFNLVKPHLTGVGPVFFCGAPGAGHRAEQAERELLALPERERLDRLPALFDEGARNDFYPQAYRNVWKAGPLGGATFNAEADRLTKRA